MIHNMRNSLAYLTVSFTYLIACSYLPIQSQGGCHESKAYD